MRLAAKRGGIIFWFAGESRANPRSDGNPFGMDTRGEINEWGARANFDPDASIFVGCEDAGERFRGWSRIERDLRDYDMLGRDFPLHQSLASLADAVAKTA